MSIVSTKPLQTEFALTFSQLIEPLDFSISFRKLTDVELYSIQYFIYTYTYYINCILFNISYIPIHII